MLTIGSTVLGVDDLDRAKAFWSAALGYVERDQGDETWQVLVSPDGAGAQLALMLSKTPVQSHPRVHLDLYTPDQAAEVRRLLALGASEVDWDMYDDDPDYVVLADPAGNRFCVVDTAHEPSSSPPARG